MSIICKLTVRNESNAPKQYLLFQDAPKPTNGPTGEVFYNVYDRSPKLESHNNAKVTWSCSNDFYAIHGTSVQRGSKTGVETSASKPVNLGPNPNSVCAVKIDQNGDCMFDADVQGTSSAKGGFTFKTNSFTYPTRNNVYIGIGGVAPRGGGNDILPLQTYIAEPNLDSQLFPKLIYFVCTGTYESGTLVDRNTIGRAVKVEFTGSAIPEVEFVQGNDGNYVEKISGKTITVVPMTTANGVKLSVSEVSAKDAHVDQAEQNGE